MEEKFFNELIQKVGAALLGQPIDLEGVKVRLVIGDTESSDACANCVFNCHCKDETADFCCQCETSDVNTWVWFEKA